CVLGADWNGTRWSHNHAADRLTDTTGVQVGDPDPWTGDYDMCEARLESAGHLTCTAPRGHTGPHTASDGDYIVAVDPARPTVTDDARAVREAAMDLYRATRRANPDAWAEVAEVEDWADWDDIVRTAQVALAAGRAEAWAEGHRTGWEHCQDGNYGNDHWDDPTPNPYAAAARAEMTAEQPCRHCGSCDGPPSCPDCDHADRRAETTTATTEDAVGEL